MKILKIKSYCKVNLSLRVIKKLKSGYHNIASLITFCDLHDVMLVTKIKNPSDEIIFSGKFGKGINKKINTLTKVLSLLRKKKLIGDQAYRISIKKNIPHGAGLGGGSSNAANLLNFFNSKIKPKLSKKKIEELANQIGFDVPVNLYKKNSFITGKRNKILKFKKKFKLNLLIVYPNLVCSTERVYKKNKKLSLLHQQPSFKTINKKKLINYLQNEQNDLENTVVSIYPKVKKVIDYIKSQKGCCFSRITGSGSACIGIFSNMNNAIYAQKLIKLKYPKYWCVVSKTI